MRIGVLAIQGDYAKHRSILLDLKVEAPLVREKTELAICDGLIIPGGESTTLSTLMEKHDLWQSVIKFGQRKSIFGTCAGIIVLAADVPGHGRPTLGLLDISVTRNAYGRQIDSFIDDVTLILNGKSHAMPGIFIRAPKITHCGEQVKIIGHYHQEIVMVENDNIMACTFHPELTSDPSVHQYFIHKTTQLMHS